ncbi:MAG: precorrin-2 C(20)-methyltransferase [Caldimicrobium sp.]|jgi:precorrin-2/cobalt-factor-2 C20-methyltransferase
MKLYVVGVGPGDPELITLKALNILRKVSLIFFPTGGKETLALSIVEALIPLKEKTLVELYFPMKKNEDLSSHWENLSQIIYKELTEKKEGVFITLGDPAFYSTFFYLKPYLEEKEVSLEVIPGISSISALASKFAIPLGLNKEEVLVTNAENLLKTPEKYVTFSTLVIMKCHKYIEALRDFAKKFKFSVYIGKRVGQNQEKLWYNPTDIKEEKPDYFTLVILKQE